jgi:hypothetical protein
MTVKMSEQTALQTDLFGAFLKAIQATKDSIIGAARAYRACVDAGVDMSPQALKHAGVSRKLINRLDKLSSGALIEETSTVLLAMPDAMVNTLASLPKDVQKDLLANGVPLVRAGKTLIVSVEDVQNTEAKRIVDSTGGRARLLTPEEQAERQEPVKPRSDKMVELRFTPAEFATLAHKAHKAGHSVEHYLKRQLYLEGTLEGAGRRQGDGVQALSGH